MSEPRNAGMIVRYVDGNVNKFTFTRKEDEVNAMKRIDEALTANWLVLELEDRALLIPVHSIRNIEVIPKPPSFPSYAIRNVRIVT